MTTENFNTALEVISRCRGCTVTLNAGEETHTVTLLKADSAAIEALLARKFVLELEPTGLRVTK